VPVSLNVAPAPSQMAILFRYRLVGDSDSGKGLGGQWFLSSLGQVCWMRDQGLSYFSGADGFRRGISTPVSNLFRSAQRLPPHWPQFIQLSTRAEIGTRRQGSGSENLRSR